MIKLLVNAPTVIQEVIEVGEGGGYFDSSRVIWDERADGPLPAITLGGMVRQGNALVFDAARLAQSNAVAADSAKAAIRAQIVTLETSQLMPRATREFMLLLSESMATPEQLALNPGYQAVKEFDLQIKALRDQLV